MIFVTAVFFGIFFLGVFLIFGIVIRAFVNSYRERTEATRILRGRDELRARRANPYRGTPGRPAARASRVTPSAPEETFFTRMRKVLSK